jgi:hypothetical protein
MKRIVSGSCLVGATLLAAAGAWSQDTHSISASSAVANSPYATILARNSFGLLPIRIAPPAGMPLSEAPPTITLTGAMSIFGKDQALFKVAHTAKHGQPAKEDSYVLAEGEGQDGITVVKINLLNGIITFDTHGITQELALLPAKDSGSSGGLGGGGTAANNGITMLSERPISAYRTYQSVVDSPVTAEQSAILIEAQRMKALRSGNNRLANMLPPTPLTQQNMRQNGPGTGVVPQ